MANGSHTVQSLVSVAKYIFFGDWSIALSTYIAQAFCEFMYVCVQDILIILWTKNLQTQSVNSNVVLTENGAHGFSHR